MRPFHAVYHVVAVIVSLPASLNVVRFSAGVIGVLSSPGRA